MKKSDKRVALRTMRKSAELARAAPQVIARRGVRLGMAGWPPGERDQREVVRMGAEKVQAFSQSALAIAVQATALQQQWALQAAAQWWSMWARLWTPWLAVKQPRADPLWFQGALLKLVDSGLSPIHRTALANARRLGTVPKRPRL